MWLGSTPPFLPSSNLPQTSGSGCSTGQMMLVRCVAFVVYKTNGTFR